MKKIMLLGAVLASLLLTRCEKDYTIEELENNPKIFREVMEDCLKEDINYLKTNCENAYWLERKYNPPRWNDDEGWKNFKFEKK